MNGLLAEIAGSEGGGFDLQQLCSLGQVASFATIIAVVNVVLLTALAMLVRGAVQHLGHPGGRHRRHPDGRLIAVISDTIPPETARFEIGPGVL